MKEAINKRIQQILEELKALDQYLTRATEDVIKLLGIKELPEPLRYRLSYKTNLRLELQSLNRQLKVL